MVESSVDDAFSAYNYFDKPQTVYDIDITISKKTIGSSCDTYYDYLLPNFTYQISPKLIRQPKLQLVSND